MGAVAITDHGNMYGAKEFYDAAVKAGDLLPIAFGTPMHIRNDGQENATFLIVKTPNPSEMQKAPAAP